jgi:hypothetical protein
VSVRAFAAALLGVVFSCSLGTTAARAQAVSPIDFGSTSLGDVRLGVAIATVAELADAPELLERPSSQSFVDDTFARVLSETNEPTLRVHAQRYRDDLRASAGIAFDRARADADLATFTRETLHALGVPRDRLCVVGILAEQISYNARVLRSVADDAQLRRAFARADVADGTVPGLATARARVASLPPERWPAIASAASDVVAAIVGSESQPFPSGGGVWLVLLRSRPTLADAARHGTPHLWLDVVRFDGSHRSIGAYPGSGDFARDAGKMACEAGRENDTGSEGAVPVVPPTGTTSAQLAETLEARCASTAARVYRVAAASDARFVVDLLLGAGVDAGALLKVGRLR